MQVGNLLRAVFIGYSVFSGLYGVLPVPRGWKRVQDLLEDQILKIHCGVTTVRSEIMDDKKHTPSPP